MIRNAMWSEIRVESVVARAVNVPLEYPVKTSVGTVTASPLVLVDLYLEGGTVGNAYVFTYTPLALESTRVLVQSLGAELVGKTLSPFEFDAYFARRLRLLGRSGIVTMAVAGLDMAAWDALAKLYDAPLATLLGGEVKPIPAYDSHSMDGEEVGLLRAERAMESGFQAIKIKIGYRDLSEDCRIVELIRNRIGNDVSLMVDYNQSLTAPEAVRRIHALQAYGLAWVEEPTLQEDYDGHAQVRGAVGIPIQMGENWCGVREMQLALDAGACDLVMPDVMKIGGVTGWMKAATLAELRGLPMSSHIFQEISAHLLAVTPTAHWLERMALADSILQEPLRFDRGAAIPSDRPGSGVAWKEDAVQRYLV